LLFGCVLNHGAFRAVYDAINGERGHTSTSTAHKVAHKLFTQWLMESDYPDRRLGMLAAEKPFGSPVRYLADVVAYWWGPDTEIIEAVEVQHPLHYLHTVRYDGRREFKCLVRHLEKEGIIDSSQKYNILKKNKHTRGYFHFHTDVPPKDLDVEKVDRPSELVRKCRKWSQFNVPGALDELSFLVGDEYLDMFRRDAGHAESPVARFYTISGNLVEQVMSMNSWQAVHRGKRPLKMPDHVRIGDVISVEPVSRP